MKTIEEDYKETLNKLIELINMLDDKHDFKIALFNRYSEALKTLKEILLYI